MNLEVVFHEYLGFVFRFFPKTTKASNSGSSGFFVLLFVLFPLHPIKDFICIRSSGSTGNTQNCQMPNESCKASWLYNAIWAFSTFIFVLFSFSTNPCSPTFVVSQNKSSILCYSNTYLALSIYSELIILPKLFWICTGFY